MAVRWLNRDEQAAWRAYLLSTQLVDEALDRQLQRDAGMPHAYYAILVGLSEAGDRQVRMTDLARAHRSSPSRMTHAISSMERSGWVVRRTCPTDRRSQLVEITPAGRRALEAAAPGHVEAVRAAVFDRLTPAQVAQLREIGRAIVRGFDAPA